MDQALDVSVIVVSWNTRDLVLKCLASLPAAFGASRGDVWVVDNDSSDDTVAAVRAQYPAVNVIVNDTNAGYSVATNRGVRASTGRYLFLLNSDTVVPPGAIEQLVEAADAHHAAMVGPMLLHTDGSFQGSILDAPSLLNEFLAVTGIGKRLLFADYPAHGPRRSQRRQRVAGVAGAAMLVRRTELERIGLLDESYFLYSEETDLCLRLNRAGAESWYVPEVRITHHRGQSTRQVRFAMLQMLYRSKVRFFRKHYGPLRALALRVICFVVLRVRWWVAWLRTRGNPEAQLDPPIRWRDLDTAD
jgi:GT2 family glycosyltransferase